MTLILTRHAKSDWASAALGDHDHPLNARGQRQAPLIGQWLAARGPVPDMVLCSDAIRTRQTLDLILAEIPHAPRVLHLAGLYLADPDSMLGCLRRAEGQVVMMVGHNPGIAAFAQALCTAPPEHPRFLDYPTCATSVFSFDAADWALVRPGQGRVEAFVVPADLEEA